MTNEDLREQIAHLAAEVSALSAQVFALESELSQRASVSDVGALEARISESGTAIAGAIQSISVGRAQVTKLESDIAPAAGHAAAIRGVSEWIVEDADEVRMRTIAEDVCRKALVVFDNRLPDRVRDLSRHPMRR